MKFVHNTTTRQGGRVNVAMTSEPTDEKDAHLGGDTVTINIADTNLFGDPRAALKKALQGAIDALG